MLPELGKIIIPIVAEIVKGIVDIAKSKKEDERITTSSIDEKSSVEEIDGVIEAFSNYREQVRGKTAELEKILLREIEGYIGELRSLLDEHYETIKKYGLKPEMFERRFKRLVDCIRGSMDREMSKRISLDNNECRQIMRRISGDKRKEEFFDDTVKIVLDKCCEEFQRALGDFFEETEEEITEAIMSVQKENELNAINLASIDKDNYAEKTLEIQKKAYCTMSVCELIESIVGEE